MRNPVGKMTAAEIAAALPAEARTDFPSINLPLVARGKVREIFDLGDAFLMVASDRLSAYDVVLPDGIPGKGIILNQVSLWWFAQTTGIIGNHLLPDQAAQFDRRGITDPDLRLRSMIVRKLTPLTIECVVRGYLVGSGWSAYRASGQVCGHPLPPGLKQAQILPEPLFTPTTKAAVGDHDEHINDAQGAEAIGPARYEQVKATSLQLYQHGREVAKRAGIILADTKFEFGTDAAGNLVLIDEVLTPDSSRYWPADEYRTGISPPSYDKQFVRDYLTDIEWNKRPPAPSLPTDIVARTQTKYLGALERLLG